MYVQVCDLKKSRLVLGPEVPSISRFSVRTSRVDINICHNIVELETEAALKIEWRGRVRVARISSHQEKEGKKNKVLSTAVVWIVTLPTFTYIYSNVSRSL